MAGVIAPNLPTFQMTAADVTARNAEYTGTPFSDVNGNGDYLTYLGCNRAGSCAPGIGICTGVVLGLNTALIADKFQSWTRLDQDGLARTPQDSDYIGNTGFVDRSTLAWPSSGGVEGVPTNPIKIADHPNADYNDTANLVLTNAAAINGAIMDTVTGAINNTGQTVAIGDLIWGKVPVT